MATKVIRKPTTISSTWSNRTRTTSDLRPQIEIGVNRDGSLRVAAPTVDLGYCGDNNVTGILFNLDDLANATGIELDRYHLSLICVHDLVSYKLDFDTDGFWVNKYITSFPGIWEFTVVIEEINPETNTENVAAEVERFTSATFKGKVKESNYDWKEIAHYDDTLPTFESSDLPSLYKNEIRLNTITTQLGTTVAGYKNDRFMSYVTLPFGPDSSVWQSAKLFFYNGEEVIAYNMTVTNENVFGCWVAPRITEQSGIWEAMVLLEGEDKELCSNTFQVKVLDNASDRNAIDPNVTPLTLLYDGDKMRLADKNAAKMRAVGETPTYNLKYSGEEVDGLLDAVNSGAVGTNAMEHDYLISKLDGSTYWRFAQIDDPTQSASGHFKITTSATRVGWGESTPLPEDEDFKPGFKYGCDFDIPIKTLLNANYNNIEYGLKRDNETIENYAIQYNYQDFPDYTEDQNVEWSRCAALYCSVPDAFVIHDHGAHINYSNTSIYFDYLFYQLEGAVIDTILIKIYNPTPITICGQCPIGEFTLNPGKTFSFQVSREERYDACLTLGVYAWDLQPFLNETGLDSLNLSSYYGFSSEDITIWINLEQACFRHSFGLTNENSSKSQFSIGSEDANSSIPISEWFESPYIETPVTLSYQEFKCGRLENGKPFFLPMINTGEVSSDSNGSSGSGEEDYGGSGDTPSGSGEEDSGPSGSGEESYSLVNEEAIDLASDTEVEAISDEGVEVTSDDGYSGSEASSDSGSDAGSDSGSDGSSTSAGWGFNTVEIVESPKNNFYIRGFLHFNTTNNYKDINVNVKILDAENLSFFEETIIEQTEPSADNVLEGSVINCHNYNEFIVSVNVQDYINAITQNKIINITCHTSDLNGNEQEPFTVLAAYDGGLVIANKGYENEGWPTNVLFKNINPNRTYVLVDDPSSNENFWQSTQDQYPWFELEDMYIDSSIGMASSICIDSFTGTIYRKETYRSKSYFSWEPRYDDITSGRIKTLYFYENGYHYVIAEAEKEPVADYARALLKILDWDTTEGVELTVEADLSNLEYTLVIPVTPDDLHTDVILDRYTIENNNDYNFNIKLKSITYQYRYIKSLEDISQLIDQIKYINTNFIHRTVEERIAYHDLVAKSDFDFNYHDQEEEEVWLGNKEIWVRIYDILRNNAISPIPVRLRIPKVGASSDILLDGIMSWMWHDSTVKISSEAGFYISFDFVGEYKVFGRPDDLDYESAYCWIPYSNTPAEVLWAITGKLPLQYKNPIICELETSIKNQLGDIESILDILNGEAQ